MKPAWNRGLDSNVVLLMDGSEEIGAGMDWRDEVPATQRCIYVQDRDSRRWSAQALAETVEVEAIVSASAE
jgi:hypothetical protein